MPEFTEKDCSIEHEGRKFESGGAFNTGNRMIAYLGKEDGKLVITDWHGAILTREVKLLSVKNMGYRGVVSDKLLYLRFRYDGKIYSGTSSGEGMDVKAKVTKLKKL